MQEGSKESAVGVFWFMEPSTLLTALTQLLGPFFLPTCCPVFPPPWQPLQTQMHIRKQPLPLPPPHTHTQNARLKREIVA